MSEWKEGGKRRTEAGRSRGGVPPKTPSVQYRDGLAVEKVVAMAAGESAGGSLCKLSHFTEQHE